MTEDLHVYLEKIVHSQPYKLVISKTNAGAVYQKLVLSLRGTEYFAEQFTDKQVFHTKVAREGLLGYCADSMAQFSQLNAWDEKREHMLTVKKGKTFYNAKNVQAETAPKVQPQHNREKQYILREDAPIAPLVDMGIFTKDGVVVRTMYDKFRQVNRFIETIDDFVRGLNQKSIHIIDFGCGKSYLTFVLYYYLTEVMHLDAHIVGLDLKHDVIDKCNAAAKRYGYSGLRFELGDINGYQCDFDVDMVVTLHACDTATDYALYNAVQWNAKAIFSVPCCQHEVNGQMNAQTLGILTRYGIVQERFSALLTDAIRANILTLCGYKTQLLEFVDLSHTPKNILIRAVKADRMPAEVRQKALAEIEAALKEFQIEPTLYRLLKDQF